MRTFLITGAGRGIGRELVRILLARGERVIASVRDASRVPSEWARYREGGQLDVLSLDVRDGASIAEAAKAVSGPVDVLVNNAGIIGPERQSTLDMDFDGFLDTLAVNTLGPLRVSQAFLPHLRQASFAKIVTISSRMGSLSYAKSDHIAYRASKAAVNKVMQGLATDLHAEGISVVAVHPGWVRTEMGGSGADIDVEESAAGLADLIDRLSLSDTGKFFDWEGKPLEF